MKGVCCGPVTYPLLMHAARWLSDMSSWCPNHCNLSLDERRCGRGCASSRRWRSWCCCTQPCLAELYLFSCGYVVVFEPSTPTLVAPGGRRCGCGCASCRQPRFPALLRTTMLEMLMRALLRCEDWRAAKGSPL